MAEDIRHNGGVPAPGGGAVAGGAVRIVDIARMAGVSAGTVDRFIHNRGKVSAENRRKIQAVLDEVGYRPNLVARSLALKKHFHIVAVIPSFEPGQYWEAMAGGIDRAAAELAAYNVRVERLAFDQYDRASFDRAAAALLGMEADGVLIATLFNNSVTALSRELDNRGVPYVYVDSNIEGGGQLAYFGTHSYDGGRIAARLLTEHTGARGDLLVARLERKGRNGSHQGDNRRRGFMDYLCEAGRAGVVREVVLRPGDAAHNDAVLDEALARYPDVSGAVLFNSTCYLLGEYLQRRGLRHIRLVGYDLIARNTALLHEGVVTALIGQRPEAQGYEAVKALADYFIQKKVPAPVNLMPIDILIKENIRYYRP